MTLMQKIWLKPGDSTMKKALVLFTLAAGLTACAQMEPEPFAPSAGHILDAETPAVETQIPELVETVPALPEPSAQVPQERYTVVVNEVPVKELLFALARDAKINVDIHSAIQGSVTINAVEQTLPQILKRISKQVDMRYEYDGDNLFISQDSPFLRTYIIDYVNMSRDMNSTNTVATQISSTSGSGAGAAGGGGGGGGGGAGGNNSTTDVTSDSDNNYWDTLAANIIAILAEDNSNTDVIANSVIANPESGLLTVRATARQHEEIQRFIDQSIASAKRQVLIRVTIAEVQLNDEYQAGVNWSLINEATRSGINVVANTFTAAAAGTVGTLVLEYQDNESRDQRFNASLQLLDQFGDTRILSSPQLMVLNNQTALLKVVENIVYFEVDAETTQTQTNAVTTVDTTAQTVPVGIVMTVTPQISESGEILLNVRPTISRVTEFVNDPNPSIADANTENPVPQIVVREMESMLRLTDGQIGVLGGLMQDRESTNDDGIAGLNSLPGIGALFNTKTISQTKTELVIFLQPFVINNPGLRNDLEQYRDYLNDFSAGNTVDKGNETL